MIDAAGRRARVTATWSLVALGIVAVAGHVMSLPGEVRSMVFHDELHYAQQARDIAAGGWPRYNRFWQPKYPPVYGAALAVPRALVGRERFPFWSRVLNAVLLASTLWPAYRLARRDLNRPWSVTAAALSVIGSVWIYPRLLMAENALLPLATAFALALRRYYARPTTARGLLAGVALASCLLTKTSTVVLLPAAVLGAAWARGPRLLEAVRAASSLGAGVLAASAPWLLRRFLSPAEAVVQPLYSYRDEFTFAGWQPLSHYLYWLRAEPICFVVGLGGPVFVLALAGFFAWLRQGDAERRGLAVFGLVAAALVSLQVSLWVAQVASWAPKYQERYFIWLWPLFILSFVRLLRESEPARGPRAVATAVGLAVLIMTPAPAFGPEHAAQYLFDSAAFVQTSWLWTLFGSTAAVRIVLAASCLLVWLPSRTGWAVGLVALTTLHQGHAQWLAVRAVRAREYWARAATHVPFRLLDPILRPGDGVVHHTALDDVAYHVALRYEMPLSIVGRDLEGSWESPVRYDRAAGRFVFWKGAPAGRTFLLTRAELAAHVPPSATPIAASDPYRLYELPAPTVEQERRDEDGDDAGEAEPE